MTETVFVKIMSTEKIPKENEGLLGSTQNSNNIHIIKSSTTKDSEGKADVFLRSWISNEPGDHSHLSLVFPFIKCWGLCFYTTYLVHGKSTTFYFDLTKHYRAVHSQCVKKAGRV